MNNTSGPIDIEDERVGNFYKNVRSGQPYIVTRCFVWEDEKYLTMENPYITDDKFIFCGSDEKFWLNFQEPFYCEGEVAQR